MTHREPDLDPPPSHDPRLYGSCDGVASSRSRVAFKGNPLSQWRLTRLRKIAIIHACRSHNPPIPYTTLIAVLQISEDTAARYAKLGEKLALRRSRV